MDGWKKKRQIMRRYNATASIYDKRYAEEQAAKIEAALQHVKISKNDCVLDVGCGTGFLFDYVADKASITIGLDISKKSLLEAKQRAKNSGNVNLVLADADNMPFKDKLFSRVFAFTVVQNVPDPARMLTEIRRVSKDNATFVVTGLKKLFYQEAFEGLLQEAGLSIIVLDDAEKLKCYVAVCRS
jgi:ubiquinone/menaquinone biosynthesis C-methylase UbiE